jgi:hypothetical protein
MHQFTWTLFVLLISSGTATEFIGHGYKTENHCWHHAAIIEEQIHRRGKSIVLTKCVAPVGIMAGI